MKNKYSTVIKIGFTLSEVLIALVIIGVIAAITVPVIFENYKKQETISRLKKTYSTLSQGLRTSQTENGPFSEWPIAEEMEVSSYFKQYWHPYFQIMKQARTATELGYKSNNCWKNINQTQIGWNVMSATTRILFALNDGTVVFYPRNTTDGDGNPVYVSYFYVDINGPKNPNIIGKDVFIFQVVDFDNLKPYCWERSTQSINAGCSRSMTAKSTNCCAAKIINDGWQIKKDYPW